VIATIDRLRTRIAERFPGSGLQSVCAELSEHARTVSRRARRAARPYLFLRAMMLASILAAAAVAAWAGVRLAAGQWTIGPELSSLTVGLDAAVHLLVVAWAAVWTLLTLEQRLKRSRALGDLYQLRSFAHVIDMHQLTKDPTAILSPGPPTSSSPDRGINQFLLTRYLDYCSEMLSLVGKLAALYGEYTRDPQVLEAINDIEELCGSLSRKIWQKITILGALDESRAAGAPANAP
jgi:hypothetical protein